MTNSPETETTMTLLMSVQRNMDGVWSPTSHCGAKKHLLASVDGSGLSTYSSVGTVSSLNIQSPLRLNYMYTSLFTASTFYPHSRDRTSYGC